MLSLRVIFIIHNLKRLVLIENFIETTLRGLKMKIGHRLKYIYWLDWGLLWLTSDFIQIVIKLLLFCRLKYILVIFFLFVKIFFLLNLLSVCWVSINLTFWAFLILFLRVVFTLWLIHHWTIFKSIRKIHLTFNFFRKFN